MHSPRLHSILLATVAVLLAALYPVWAADSDALWKIISGECAPCVQKGPGFVVMKDHKGIAQYLVLPSAKITGIESPEILADESPNYWAAAWAAKSFMDQKLPQPLARDWTSLAINSAYGRSQNQLHIHVDCFSSDAHTALAAQLDRIGPQWAALPTGLKGHPYWARALDSADLLGVNPFVLLADGIPGARQHMDRQTLVVVGATLADHNPGFILLANQADLTRADLGHGEELQDHDCRP